METKSFLIESAFDKPMATDVRYKAGIDNKPLLIFSHGFKGFKDWGHFPQLAERFADHGFFVVSFNYSHNGTTPDKLTEFVDLDAFGNNNYSKQLDDLGAVLDQVLSNQEFSIEIDPNQVYLWGHSMGAGISILKAAEDLRVKKVLAWSSVGDFEKRVTAYNEEDWKKEGVMYVNNLRTNQQLPLYYQLYTDFYENRNRVDLLKNGSNVKIPVQFIHGSDDEAVELADVKALQKKLLKSKLNVIKGANHTFGGKHPWMADSLPSATQEAMEISLGFLKG